MLLRPDWMMVPQCTENSKVPPHEISRRARVKLSVCQGTESESCCRGRRCGGREAFRGGCPLLVERDIFLLLVRLTEEERRRQHLGVVGTLPAAVLEVRGKSEDIVLGVKGQPQVNWERTLRRSNKSPSGVQKALLRITPATDYRAPRRERSAPRARARQRQ